jgi:hypothetical protein
VTSPDRIECRNLSLDRTNCGACGHVCGSEERCNSGVCECLTSYMTSCGTGAAARCFDLNTNHENCGVCGHACPLGGDCVSGMCDCGARTLCGGRCCSTVTTCAGTCTCLDQDRQNCGVCGHVCPTSFDGGVGSCINGICY